MPDDPKKPNDSYGLPPPGETSVASSGKILAQTQRVYPQTYKVLPPDRRKPWRRRAYRHDCGAIFVLPDDLAGSIEALAGKRDELDRLCPTLWCFEHGDCPRTTFRFLNGGAVVGEGEAGKRAALLERLAAEEHAQWAHYTRYLLAHLTPESVLYWQRQIDTPYEDLSEKEKASDRAWAERALRIVEEVTGVVEE